MASNQKKSPLDYNALSEQEKKVVTVLREIKFGEVKVIVQDGVPVRIDEIRKSIKI